MNVYLKIVDPWSSRSVRTIKRVGRYLLVGAAFTTLASTIIGCEYLPESTFQLASESRLPKWITLPPGLTRADVSITMSLYNLPWGPHAVFILKDAQGKILEKTYGEEKCSKPYDPNNPPPKGFPLGYPLYEEITVKGTAEIIEHRKMEPVFYIADDPAIWKEYWTIGCR